MGFRLLTNENIVYLEKNNFGIKWGIIEKEISRGFYRGPNNLILLYIIIRPIPIKSNRLFESKGESQVFEYPYA